MNFENRLERFQQLYSTVYCQDGCVAYGPFRYLDISVNTTSSTHIVNVYSGCRNLYVQEYLGDTVYVYLQKEHEHKVYRKNILIRDVRDGIYVASKDKIVCTFLKIEYLNNSSGEEVVFALDEGDGLYFITLVQFNKYSFCCSEDSKKFLIKNKIDFDTKVDDTGFIFQFSYFFQIKSQKLLEIEEIENKKVKINPEMKHIGNKELMLEYIRKNGKREIEIECPDKRIYRTRLEYWGGFLDATVNFSPKLTSNFSLETLELVEDYINGKHSHKTLELWEALDYHGIPHCFEVSSINCELVDGLNHKVPTIRRRFWLYHISQSFKKDGSIFQWIAMIEPQYNDEFMKYMSEYSRW